MWQERLFPELQRLETPQERRELLTAVERRTVGLFKRIAFLVVLGAVAGLVCSVALIALARWLPIPRYARGPVTGAIVGAASIFAVHIFWRRPLQREIRRELNQRGVPVCVRCGYDLTGLTQRRCPECATPF